MKYVRQNYDINKYIIKQNSSGNTNESHLMINVSN